MVTKLAVRTEGPFVAEFVEAHCRITQGPRTGELVELLPFQQELLDALFLLRADGLRQYRQALIQMPRKNGKTFLAACVALYEAVTGEPGGEVYFVAGDRQQARRAFEECKRIIQMDPELVSLFTIYRNVMEVPGTGTVLRVLSSDAGLQQGLSPSFVIFDEVAVQPNADLWNAMTLGSGARTQPLVVGISTPGWSKESLLWRLYDYGKRMEAGEVDDPTFFFRSWEPSDPECDYRDPAVWAESNPALGHFLHEEDFVATVTKTPELDFRRFRLGQWTSTSAAALPYGVWDECADPEQTVEDAERVLLAFDGTHKRDSTALLLCRPGEVPHVSVVEIWEAPDRDPDLRRSVKDITASILEACRGVEVLEVVADTVLHSQIMEEVEKAGITVVAIPTGYPQKMATAWQHFHDAVMDKGITHDGDVALARHLSNLQIHSDKSGTRPVREQTSPRAFVSGGMAAVLAVHRAIEQVDLGSPGMTVIDL